MPRIARYASQRFIHGVLLSCHRTSKENVTLAPGTISCGSALMHELEGAEVPTARSSHLRVALHGNTSNLTHAKGRGRGRGRSEEITDIKRRDE